jgi:hypothetical protein
MQSVLLPTKLLKNKNKKKKKKTDDHNSPSKVRVAISNQICLVSMGGQADVYNQFKLAS